MFIKDYNKTALIIGDTKISYAEVIEKVRQYSTLIDISRGERCAIFFENRPEWVYTFFAGWNTGVINVPIDMMSTAGEVTHIIKTALRSWCLLLTRPARLTEALRKSK
jgi:long-chain acyl-CoA synthetase